MCRSEHAFSDIIAVTNRKLCDRPFTEQVKRICSAHPAALLLREKDLAPKDYLALAGEVLAICAQYDVRCILHTYAGVVECTGNRRLHLPLAALRELKASDKRAAYDMLGCSVHSVEDAMEAEALGATYLVAGHIYATDCKRGVPPRGISFLSEVCTAVSLPVYAIGGIHVEGKMGTLGEQQPCKWQLHEIFSCGAKGACIMSGMMRL